MVTKRNPIYLKTFAFISGISILIYEIIWIRQLSLVFGNTIIATAIVIAVFMAGLGFGSLYYGKKVDHHTAPLKLFGLLQISIGGSALAAFIVFNRLPEIQRMLFKEISTDVISLLFIALITLLCICPTGPGAN